MKPNLLLCDHEIDLQWKWNSVAGIFQGQDLIFSHLQTYLDDLFWTISTHWVSRQLFASTAQEGVVGGAKYVSESLVSHGRRLRL